MCERCMCVPPWKYERGPRSTSPSVSKLTIRRGPSAFRCVDVKPRKSSEPSGMRSAPGTPAAVAISFGSPLPPSIWPAKPLRMLVTASAPFIRSAISVAAARMFSSLSLRKRNATSLSSSSVSWGSLGKRIASMSAASCAPGGRTAGARLRPPATCVPEVRQAPRDREPEPVGRRGIVGVELGEHGGQRRARVEQLVLRRDDPGRDHLVVPKRHDDLDAFLLLDAQAVDQVLLGLVARNGIARRRVGELVHELVDPRRAEGGARGSADEQLLPGELHRVRLSA